MQCGNTKSTKGNGLVHVILATESSIKNESIKISAIGNMTPLRSSGPLWRGVMESGRIDPMPATEKFFDVACCHLGAFSGEIVQCEKLFKIYL